MNKYIVHIVHTEHAEVIVEAENEEQAKRAASFYERDWGMCNWGDDEDSYSVFLTDKNYNPNIFQEDVPEDWEC